MNIYEESLDNIRMEQIRNAYHLGLQSKSTDHNPFSPGSDLYNSWVKGYILTHRTSYTITRF